MTYKYEGHEIKAVDARGLSCPEPVLLTKQAVQEGSYPFAVLVDDTTPYENIRRFAKAHKKTVTVDENGGEYAIVFTE